MYLQTHLDLYRLWLRLKDAGMPAEQTFAGLATLLFIKMCRDPAADWRALISAPADELLPLYARLQARLGAVEDPYLAAIFQAPDQSWRTPAPLAAALRQLDALDWPEIRAYGTGEAFELFVEIYAAEQIGAPEWCCITPQSLAGLLAGLLQIEPGETVIDPLAGTGSLLSAAHAYRQALLYEEPATYLVRQFSSDNGLYAGEAHPQRLRLAQMGLYLHDVPYCPFSARQIALPAADVLLANVLDHGGDDEAAQCQAQLALWAQCVTQLKPGGRAALIIGDPALSRGEGRAARRQLLDTCNLHTLLRLPEGLFHGHDVSAHVLFFTRQGPTRGVWYYDLRTGLPWFDPQHAPFQPHYFNPFIDVYGDLPDGGGRRKDNGAQGRFRHFSQAELSAGEDNLDLCWLSEDSCDFPLFVGKPRQAQYNKASLQAVSAAVAELKDLSALLRL